MASSRSRMRVTSTLGAFIMNLIPECCRRTGLYSEKSTERFPKAFMQTTCAKISRSVTSAKWQLLPTSPLLSASHSYFRGLTTFPESQLLPASHRYIWKVLGFPSNYKYFQRVSYFRQAIDTFGESQFLPSSHSYFRRITTTSSESVTSGKPSCFCKPTSAKS